MILKDSIEINAKPEKIYQWFTNIAKNYCDWHKDHIVAKWLKGEPFAVDSILYAEEKLHGEIHKLKFKTIKNEKNRFIEFKNLFPTSIISPKGSFILEPKGNKTLFTATLSFRMGRLLANVLKKQYVQLRKHMEEEGINLKKLMEKAK